MARAAPLPWRCWGFAGSSVGCRSGAPYQPHQAELLTLTCSYTMGPGAVFLLYSMLGFIFLLCHPTKSPQP